MLSRIIPVIVLLPFAGLAAAEQLSLQFSFDNSGFTEGYGDDVAVGTALRTETRLRQGGVLAVDLVNDGVAESTGTGHVGATVHETGYVDAQIHANPDIDLVDCQGSCTPADSEGDHLWGSAKLNAHNNTRATGADRGESLAGGRLGFNVTQGDQFQVEGENAWSGRTERLDGSPADAGGGSFVDLNWDGRASPSLCFTGGCPDAVLD